MKKLFVPIFLFFSFVCSNSLYAQFYFKDFAIGDSFSRVNTQIEKISNADLQPVKDNYFSTGYFQSGNKREKILCGFKYNSLNLVMEYFLLNNEEDFLSIKQTVTDYLNANYKWSYTNNHQAWAGPNTTIRFFSSKIQMDGKEGYTFWVMYAGNISFDASEYIYEPFHAHKVPMYPASVKEDSVYWKMGENMQKFSSEHKDLKFVAQDKLRGILKNDNSSDIYVDYSFNSNELTNISINFEFSTREEQKKFYNELIQKYSTQYGEGEYESYDKDLYQHYTISDSKLIIDSQVAIAYYSRNYVLDQLNKERYLVCLIFIKY